MKASSSDRHRAPAAEAPSVAPWVAPDEAPGMAVVLATPPRHERTILVLLTPVLIVAWIRSAPPAQHLTLPTTRAAIEPNAAPWYELAALPGIGEVRAKAIVRYRAGAEFRVASAASQVVKTPVAHKRVDRSKVAFRSPSDLARVRGIGPKTVARIAPHLYFANR